MPRDSGSNADPEGRQVTLRAEIDGPDRRSLWAFYDAEGNLRIDGQDLGPKTAVVSEDGEYEWYQTIKKADIPRLLRLLGADAKRDVLDVLEERWSGANSYDLERVLRESDIEIERFVWS